MSSHDRWDVPRRLSTAGRTSRQAASTGAALDELSVAGMFVGVPARNPHMLGREADLQRLWGLRERFGATRPVVVTAEVPGRGGYGTTALVAEYAHRHRREIPVICWVDGGCLEVVDFRFASLARAVAPGDGVAVPSLREWLEECPHPWLLVVDDMDDPAYVSGLLPSRGNGQVVITSRRQDWTAMSAAVVALGPLSGLYGTQVLQRQASAMDRDAAAALAQRLGNVPLLLNVAAATINISGVSYRNYLRMLDMVGFGEEEWRSAASASPANSLEDVVVRFALERCADRHPLAPVLAGVLGHLAGGPLPASVLAEMLTEMLAEMLGGGAGDDAREPRSSGLEVSAEAVAAGLHAVAEGGLCRRRGDIIWAQRAVQSIVRRQFAAAAEVATVTADPAIVAIRLMASLLRDEDAEPSPSVGAFWSATPPTSAERSEIRESAVEALLPHAMAAVSHCRAAGVALEDTAALEGRIGCLLHAGGTLDAARAYLQRAVVTSSRLRGPGHPETMRHGEAMAAVLVDAGELVAAANLYRDLLGYATQLYGADHPLSARLDARLDDLRGRGVAVVQRDDRLHASPTSASTAGGWSGGEQAGAEALGWDGLDGADADHLARLKAEAISLYHRGEVNAAMALLDHVIEGCARRFGPRDASTTVVAWNLYAILVEVGRLGRAHQVLDQHLRWILDADPAELSAQQLMARRLLGREATVRLDDPASVGRRGDARPAALRLSGGRLPPRPDDRSHPARPPR